MKPKWKGALIGGIIGLILSIILSFINLGTSYCVKGLSLTNFFCSISATFNEFGIIATIFSIPELFFKNIFGLSGMNEVIILPLIIIVGFLIGGFIGYIIKNEK